MSSLGAKMTDNARVDGAQISVANAARDGTGTISKVAEGQADGSRLALLRIHAVAATTAGMIRIFHSIDAGTTKRLIDEIPVSAITPSATVAAFKHDWSIPDANLLADGDCQVLAATEKGEIFNIITVSEDY